MNGSKNIKKKTLSNLGFIFEPTVTIEFRLKNAFDFYIFIKMD